MSAMSSVEGREQPMIFPANFVTLCRCQLLSNSVPRCEAVSDDALCGRVVGQHQFAVQIKLLQDTEEVADQS